MWDERGQEEPRPGRGQQQDLCCWRTGGNRYEPDITMINTVMMNDCYAGVVPLLLPSRSHCALLSRWTGLGGVL